LSPEALLLGGEKSKDIMQHKAAKTPSSKDGQQGEIRENSARKSGNIYCRSLTAVPKL
jgi:hypothetical protein